MDLLVPVASGLEATVKRELARLGYGECPALRGRLLFEGDWADVARLNVSLRGGERVLIRLGEFPCASFDELYEGVFALPWEEFFTAHTDIRIDGKSVDSKLAAVKAAGGVAKKAILSRLKEKLGASVFDERGERAAVGVSLFQDVATVTLDTSGEGLHKRGYRVLAYDATLRETTAAAIVEDSVYRREKPFADPFCGSGTFAVEAALYARGIAPGLNREFAFTRFKCAPKGVLARAKEEARAAEYRGAIAPVFASDISPRAVKIAKEHARRAGVAGDISFRVGDMRELRCELPYGVLACDPPYGERLREEDLSGLYRDLARTVRALPDWSAYVLSGFEGAERAMGRADKRRVLYTADIRCGLFVYFGAKPPRRCTDSMKV